MGLFSKLKEGLTKTRNNIVSGIDSVFSGFSPDNRYLMIIVICGPTLEVSDKVNIRFFSEKK